MIPVGFGVNVRSEHSSARTEPSRRRTPGDFLLHSKHVMTPRQWLAVICIASVAGSFSLRLLCESSCASTHATRAISHCHESQETGSAVTTASDCAQHSALVAVTEIRRTTASVELLAPPAPLATFEQPAIRGVTVVIDFADTGPPTPARILPLRI
jgi:hypothetical protein